MFLHGGIVDVANSRGIGLVHPTHLHPRPVLVGTLGKGAGNGFVEGLPGIRNAVAHVVFMFVQIHRVRKNMEKVALGLFVCQVVADGATNAVEQGLESIFVRRNGNLLVKILFDDEIGPRIANKGAVFPQVVKLVRLGGNRKAVALRKVVHNVLVGPHVLGSAEILFIEAEIVPKSEYRLAGIRNENVRGIDIREFAA